MIVNMSLSFSKEDVHKHLLDLGYSNITNDQLREFMTDLKRLIRYEEKQKRITSHSQEGKFPNSSKSTNEEKHCSGCGSSTELPTVTMEIFSPIRLEDNTFNATKALHSTLSKVDVAQLRASYDLVLGLVKKKETPITHISNQRVREMGNENLSIIECDKYRSSRRAEHFYDINKKSLALKRLLSKVHVEIGDRKTFLETIKEIASAIKKLLDSLNIVANHATGEGGITLDEKKRDFVRNSKRFSNILKEYFRHGNPHFVIRAAADLIFQINEIITILKVEFDWA